MNIKFFGILLVVAFISCEKGAKLTKDSKETVVTGTTSILVDETIFPIVEDVVAVFENDGEIVMGNYVFNKKSLLYDLR